MTRAKLQGKNKTFTEATSSLGFGVNWSTFAVQKGFTILHSCHP